MVPTTHHGMGPPSLRRSFRRDLVPPKKVSGRPIPMAPDGNPRCVHPKGSSPRWKPRRERGKKQSCLPPVHFTVMTNRQTPCGRVSAFIPRATEVDIPSRLKSLRFWGPAQAATGRIRMESKGIEYTGSLGTAKELMLDCLITTSYRPVRSVRNLP
jgi:hypothetical protein